MLGDNDEDVIENVSEDEWLQKSLRLVGIKKKHAVENDNVRGQSSRNESMNVEDDRDDGSNSDDGSASDDDSDSQDSDFLVDPDNMIDDVDVDMAEFRSNIDANVEWVGSKAIVTMEEKEFEEEEVNLDELNSRSDSAYEGGRKKTLKMYHKMIKANASNADISGTTWKENFYVGLKYSNSKEIKEMVTRVAVEQRRELHLKKNDKLRVRCICRGKVPQFSCEDGDDDSGSKGVILGGSKGKGQSKEKGQVSRSKGNSNNKTKAGGGIKDKGEYCSWSLQCSKLPNEETWEVKTFKDTHKCLQSRIVKKCTASFFIKIC
ncbi:mutator type transposase [Tanacetum coccineum]